MAEEVVWKVKNGKSHGSHHRKSGDVGLAVRVALPTTCTAEAIGHMANDVRKGLASQVDQEITGMEAVRKRPRGREALTPSASSTGLAVCGWTAVPPADLHHTGRSAPRAMRARGARSGRAQRAQLTEF